MNPDVTVFYVDDDVDDLEFFRDVVQGLDQNVSLYTHNRSDELLNALKNPPPSPEVIFVDLNMPGKNGFEVLHEMRQSERLKEIPVVIFSTSGDPENVDRTRQLGANFYVQKSSCFETFRKSIQHTLNINWKTFNPSANNFMYQ